MRRIDIVDTILSHHAALVLDALHRTGVLAALQVPRAPTEIAEQCHVALDLLGPLLAFAAAVSTLVELQSDGRFVLAGGERDLAFVAHMLDQYIGGYGPPLAALATLLREGRTGESLVDFDRHAAAFADDNPAGGMSEAAKLVLDLGATGIVEFGCGGGQTLCALAEANPVLTAIGIDANAAAVTGATARVRSRGLSERVQIILGDALEVVGRTSSDGVQVVLAASMLNGLWGEAGAIVTFLDQLAVLLPGRLLVVSDYYSHLNGSPAIGTARTLLHDVVQLVTGQGLPPSNADGWATAYAAVGASFLHAFEASGDGIDRFVHLVRLPG